MSTSPDVTERLARLTADQRAAATASPGPVLCVAPAGSGKTTTLVARIAWLIDGGASPDTIAAITFNKRAAEELGERLDTAVAPLGIGPKTVRVRTFHALGREILRDAGRAVEPLVDRTTMIAELWPDATTAEIGRLDTVFSRFKLDLGVTAAEVAADPDAGPMAQAFVAYEAGLAERGGLDFDDLVRGALDALEQDQRLLARWRQRCGHLLVDEVQDVDRSQLRFALLLAAPDNRIFLVGDDDQSIYGWRLADVKSYVRRMPGRRIRSRRVTTAARTAPARRRANTSRRRMWPQFRRTIWSISVAHRVDARSSTAAGIRSTRVAATALPRSKKTSRTSPCSASQSASSGSTSSSSKSSASASVIWRSGSVARRRLRRATVPPPKATRLDLCSRARGLSSFRLDR